MEINVSRFWQRICWNLSNNASLVKWRGDWCGGLWFASFCLLFPLFSSSTTPRIQTFEASVYNKRCHWKNEVIAGIASNTSLYCLYRPHQQLHKNDINNTKFSYLNNEPFSLIPSHFNLVGWVTSNQRIYHLVIFISWCNKLEYMNN